tara:strand:- start:591 stop:839 length:249 start_codon:yes stop_codon:yes gene_type:complete
MLLVHAFVVEFTGAFATTRMKFVEELPFTKGVISSVFPVEGCVHLTRSACNELPEVDEAKSTLMRIESPTESCVMDTLNVLT